MKEEKRVLVLDRYEYGIILKIINDRRTAMLNENKDTELVNEILQKVIKAPTKKHRFYKKDKEMCYER